MGTKDKINPMIKREHIFVCIRNLKFEGHALISAIVISLIIGLIMTSLLLVNIYTQGNWVKLRRDESLKFNLESATEVILNDTSNRISAAGSRFDLFDDGHDSVFIQKDQWGIYSLGIVKSYQDEQVLSRAFIYGSKPEDSIWGAVYLVDHRRPFQVTGNVSLIGNLYCPGGQISKSVIEGRAFTGRIANERSIRKSDTLLPEINSSLVRYLKGLTAFNPVAVANNRNQWPLAGDSIVNSFFEDSKVYVTHDFSRLVAVKAAGRVIFISTKGIFVDRNCRLDNVLVIAPEIEIEGGFSGCAQFVSTKKLKIGQECKLLYPSAAILLKDSLYRDRVELILDKGAKMYGALVAIAQVQDAFKSLCEIRPQAYIEGVVYVQGYTKMEGQVTGSLFTDFILHKTSFATYENTMGEGTIDKLSLGSGFGIASIFKTSDKPIIVKWVK